MLFAQVTNEQMRAASVLSAATMAAFLAAPVFGQHAQTVRIALVGVYIVAVIAFVAYAVLG